MSVSGSIGFSFCLVGERLIGLLVYCVWLVFYRILVLCWWC